MTRAPATFTPQGTGPSHELPRLRVVAPPIQPPLAPSEDRQRLPLNAELVAEIALQNSRLETASPQEILRWTTDRFAPQFTMATAFGPEGMVLIHMLAEIAPQTPIFNL